MLPIEYQWDPVSEVYYFNKLDTDKESPSNFSKNTA
jgi:hypothetical protein